MAEAKQVVAAILAEGTRVLICQRRADQPFALQWEFPGGKVETGESNEAALRRELSEELGIAAEIGPRVASVRHQYKQGLFVELHFHAVTRYAGKLQNRIFHQLRWEERAQLQAEEFLEADRGVVEQLRRGELL